ncbi:hypothetical protein HOLleu_04255 [Holothuria leucospilota]|uniref:Uncharacterized protein n=1 Tax=Holothuria leucospilota TaxID=206669 RepID=A0A9Q1CT11_HOLLE|nr:hypothetical protein HOLleu_04255 [Holothuria leucospilota]
MTNFRTENALYFVYENDTPRDIKHLLECKYPSAKTFNINEIEGLKESVVRRKKAQAVAVIFDGLGGKRKDASCKKNLLSFKEAMGAYFKTNVVFVEVFTKYETLKSHSCDAEVTHDHSLPKSSSMNRSQIDEVSISNWFSNLIKETCAKRCLRIDNESSTDFDIFVSNISFRIKSFNSKLNRFCTICKILCSLSLVLFVVIAAPWGVNYFLQHI